MSETATQETTVKDAPTSETEIPKRKKTNKAVEHNISGNVLEVPIVSITQYDNPRREPENLYDAGYILIGNPENESFELGEDEETWMLKKHGEDEAAAVEDEFDESNFVSLIHIATSDDIEQARRYVALIEEYESINRKAEIKAISEAKTPGQISEQTVVELAESMAVLGQLVPCLVRPVGDNFTGIDGGRRIAAKLYLHCLSRISIADKTPNPIFGEKIPKLVPATIDVTQNKCKDSEVFLLSVATNLARKRFTPLQEGRVYYDMLSEINPQTKKKFTMKDAASFLHVEYGTFRNRQALWHEPEYDEDGKQIKGLTDEQRNKVASGKMLATAASKKALGEKPIDSRDGAPAPKGGKPISVKIMRDKFDETAESNEERRKAIAECMGLTLKQAVKESNDRISQMEEREMSRRG